MDENKIAALVQGKSLPWNAEYEKSNEGLCAVLSRTSSLVAVVEFNREQKAIRPVKVFRSWSARSERET
jgi:hypothetical protein